MTLPIQYAFEGQEIRALMINGEPWFVATDVLGSLQLDRKALERLDADEKGVNSIHTLGGNQEMTVINEPGLYSLVLGSRKAEAKRFKRWVTHDVLPSLRKHEAMSLSLDKGTQMAVGHCLQLLGYKRTRLGSTAHNAPRPYVYILKKLDLAQEAAA